MSKPYRGPELPVYYVTSVIPRVPISDSHIGQALPSKQNVPVTRAQPVSAYQKPNPAIKHMQNFYEKYSLMCEGIDYLENSK